MKIMSMDNLIPQFTDLSLLWSFAGWLVHMIEFQLLISLI